MPSEDFFLNLSLATDHSPLSSRGRCPAGAGLGPLAGDPAQTGTGSITNPQSLNRYAYVLNNPTSLIDPLGLHWECVTTSFNGGPPKTTCTWVPDPAPVPEPVDPCAFVSPGAYTGPPSCSIIYPTVDPGPTGPSSGSGANTGGLTIGPATPQKPDTRPLCAEVFSNALLGGGNDGNPAGDFAEQTLKTASTAAAAKSLSVQMERLLVVPLRSSTIRFWEGLSGFLDIASELIPWAGAASVILPAEEKSVSGAINGTCRGVF